MALKPIAAVKEEFVSKTGSKKTLTLPRILKPKKLSDDEATVYKILGYGPTESGKTRMLLGLLLHGFKIFVISTDMGGDGLSTVKIALKKLKREDLMENLTGVVLNDYDLVKSFCDEPADVFPEIYDEDFDFLVWDGFSTFQGVNVSEKVGEDIKPPEKIDKFGDTKELSQGREAGVTFEIMDWGAVKNMTLRNLDNFLKLNNKKTGKVWHKLLTCLEGKNAVRSGDGFNGTTSYEDNGKPLIQGAAINFITPAFDIVINTRKIGEDYKYKIIRKRELALLPIEPGDMFALWEKIASQLGIKKGAVVERLKEVAENVTNN